MSTIAEREEEIIEEFSLFDDWMEKYDHLIGMADTLPVIPEAFRNDTFLVKGCQSRVWLFAENKEGFIYYSADSDAVITKGIIAMLIRVLSGQPASEIASAKLSFIEKTGLSEHLSPTRSNGLLSMLDKMKSFAAAVNTERKS